MKQPMMSPERVFQILCAVGLLAGGWLYGDYWKRANLAATENGDSSELRAQNSELVQEVEQLEGELAQVRSMLASGPYPVPSELIGWIETDYNMVFLKTPDVRLASPTDLREAAHNNLRFVHGELGLDREGLAWELLGILPPNQRLMTQLLFVNSSGVKGVFDLTKEQILLSENFDPVSVPDRSVLARLLGQQLSFQNHPKKEWRSRDEWQAWEATHVGAAAALQARFLKRNAAANEAAWANPEPQREELLNDLEPALQSFCNFPFLEGADYSRFFYLDSRQAWAEMFRNPAISTSEILHPNHEMPKLDEIIFPETGDEILAENQLGELGLRLWLEGFAGMNEAEMIATKWAGDRYQIRGLQDKTFALTWQIRMTDKEAAQSLVVEANRSVLPALREMQPRRDIQISHSEAQVTLINSPKIK